MNFIHLKEKFIVSSGCIDGFSRYNFGYSFFDFIV